MRELAFMCILYPNALFESMTYGEVGIYIWVIIFRGA